MSDSTIRRAAQPDQSYSAKELLPAQQNELAQATLRGAVAGNARFVEAIFPTFVVAGALTKILALRELAVVVVADKTGDQQPSEKTADQQPHFCARLHKLHLTPSKLARQ